jgi:2-keto-4-pentenoate hydratase/2-oxohepta-3-ene-1,7-dioic acid hydratase in catechol pathway
MKLARYEAGGKISYGIVEGNNITPIEGDLWGEKKPSGAPVPLNSVRLLAPVVPNIMLAVALNYPSHIGDQVPSPRPELFVKGNNTLANPDDEIVIPAGCERVDYEGEVVVVMGKTCKKVTADQALSYVLGYTCGNDVSCRPWQRGDQQWFRGKSADGHGPIGPWIVTADELDPTNIWLSTRLNGKEVQRCNTGEMINNIADTIAFLSQTCTLNPGDAIFTGTSGQPLALKHGDVVEVDVEGVGVLRNSFIDDPIPSNWTDRREERRPGRMAAARA